MLIAGFPAGSFATNCYVVAPGPGEECVIVDPGQDAEPGVTELLAEYRLRPVAVLATHGHVDHIWSVAPVCGAQGIPAYIHPADRALLSDPAKGFPLQVGQQLFRGLTFTEPDDVIALADGMTLRLAGVELVVDHAPGHTPGSVTFRTGNQGESGEPSRQDGGAQGPVTKERGLGAAGVPGVRGLEAPDGGRPPGASTCCSPVTCCSPARSAAPTCRAATIRPSWTACPGCAWCSPTTRRCCPGTGRRRPSAPSAPRTRSWPGSLPGRGRPRGPGRHRPPGRRGQARAKEADHAMIRSHGAGTLRQHQAGEQVTLAGWVARRRDHGGVVFIDLRDASGVVQVVFRGEGEDRPEHALRAEFCIKVTGEVRERPAGNENPELPTGQIEVVAEELEVLGEAEPLPFPVEGAGELSEDIRLRYRYLDIRRAETAAALRLRSEASYLAGDVMREHGFV